MLVEQHRNICLQIYFIQIWLHFSLNATWSPAGNFVKEAKHWWWPAVNMKGEKHCKSCWGLKTSTFKNYFM